MKLPAIFAFEKSDRHCKRPICIGCYANAQDAKDAFEKLDGSKYEKAILSFWSDEDRVKRFGDARRAEDKAAIVRAEKEREAEKAKAAELAAIERQEKELTERKKSLLGTIKEAGAKLAGFKR